MTTYLLRILIIGLLVSVTLYGLGRILPIDGLVAGICGFTIAAAWVAPPKGRAV